MNEASSEMMIMVADIGNTRMVFGLYDDSSLVCHWQLSSARGMTADELALQLSGLFHQHGLDAGRVKGVMAASVVPQLDGVLTGACRTACGCVPAFLGTPEVKTGMAVDYKNPREVGAARIANAVAARNAFGSPVIIIDCGTATTFDIVSADGHYAGGLILPGMEVALAALSERAARLPEVSLARPSELIARDTVSSMQAGSYWSLVDGIAGIIRRLKAIDGYAAAPVIARKTGEL